LILSLPILFQNSNTQSFVDTLPVLGIHFATNDMPGLFQDGRELVNQQYKYKVEKKLGEGGFGVATLLKLTPPVTSKVYRQEIKYVVRKEAHRNREAAKLLLGELDKLHAISKWYASHGHLHVSSFCLVHNST